MLEIPSEQHCQGKLSRVFGLSDTLWWKAQAWGDSEEMVTVLEKWLQYWRNGSIGRVLGMQVGGPEFRSSSLT